jgi:hypothetical protein
MTAPVTAEVYGTCVVCSVCGPMHPLASATAYALAHVEQDHGPVDSGHGHKPAPFIPDPEDPEEPLCPTCSS